MIDVHAIGFKAHAWLAASGGRARVVAARAASAWLAVGEPAQMIWLGPRDEMLHGRAVLGTARLDGAGAGDPIEVLPRVAPWRPVAAAVDPVRFSAAARRLRAAAASLGPPAGFGARLAGRPLAFPLDGAAAAADALARACARDDAGAAAAAAMSLVGVGAGLTPSGDDFVGGAFFARAALARAAGGDHDAWRAAADAVRARATRGTHRISAALLGDLLDGDGWASLHDCAVALGRGDDGPALAAARRLAALGHSSGWDLLAGLLAGAGA
ncbi:MAG TPA: DUF2877 domain-containing protein [Methylomirabilota bacterium]|nr:DUF2877 domain-containing protein [Methylomirabilota bacterium]